MKKHLTKALMLSTAIVLSLTGCNISNSLYKTVDGVTTGKASVSTNNKGSASFKADEDQTELTNFSFSTDYDVKVEIVEDPIVHTRATLHTGKPDFETAAFVFDGHYTEDFDVNDSKGQFNDLYQSIFDADDKPFTADIDEMDGSYYEDGVLGYQVLLSDGVAAFLVGVDTDKYIVIASNGEDGELFDDLLEEAIEALGSE